MTSNAPTPIDPIGRRRPRSLERLMLVYGDTLLGEAIASAARSDGYGAVSVVPDAGTVLGTLCQEAPTLVLGEIGLLALNDFDLLHILMENAPAARVVAVCNGDGESLLAIDALAHGAAGLACRNQGITSLFRVLDLVRDGETTVPRHLTAALVHSLRQRPMRTPNTAQLSARQRDVLRLVARGATDKDICQQLNISLTTVRSHLAAIFEKTATGNRTAAALWANTFLDDVAS